MMFILPLGQHGQEVTVLNHCQSGVIRDFCGAIALCFECEMSPPQLICWHTTPQLGAMSVGLCDLWNVGPHWRKWVIGGRSWESPPVLCASWGSTTNSYWTLHLPLPQTAAVLDISKRDTSSERWRKIHPPSLELFQPGIATEARKAMTTHRRGESRKRVFRVLSSPPPTEAKRVVHSCHACFPLVLRSQNPFQMLPPPPLATFPSRFSFLFPGLRWSLPIFQRTVP